ncbi:MAG: teichoic acid transporter ATP-binding protein [Bacteroidetes bacterium]|nr:teichoic acid transporter ATP-binding protein [Bacteroidota bacterium]
MEKSVIQLNDVSVSYLHNKRGIYSIKDFMLKGAFLSPFEHKQVLHNINLEVYKGQTLGILGKNGEGKSTLLRTIAGIIVPDTGTCKVTIEISPVLALGAGLELELTGLENIKIYMALSGRYQKNTIASLIDTVAAFSELSMEQLKMPVKMYSTGMLARLAFSTVMATQPNLLMIDEVLAVGDKGFQEKCKKRIHEVKNAGATVLFVSHNPEEVMEVCERGICLKEGKIICDSTSQDAVKEYYNLFN